MQNNYDFIPSSLMNCSCQIPFFGITRGHLMVSLSINIWNLFLLKETISYFYCYINSTQQKFKWYSFNTMSCLCNLTFDSLYTYMCVCWCVFTQPLHHEQNVIQGQYLSGVMLVWIQSFFLYLYWLLYQD